MKIVHLFFNRYKIYSIHDTSLKFFIRNENAIDEIQNSLNRDVGAFKFLAKVFFITYGGMGLACNLSPIILRNNKLPFALILPGFYPDTTFNYYFNYGVQTCVTFIIWCLCSLFDIFNVSAFLMISSKARVLSILAKNFNKTIDNKNITETKKFNEFKMILKLHQEYLR